MRIIITILMGFFLMGCDEEAIQSYLDSLPKEDQEDIARIAPEIIDDAAAALKYVQTLERSSFDLQAS